MMEHHAVTPHRVSQGWDAAAAVDVSDDRAKQIRPEEALGTALEDVVEAASRAFGRPVAIDDRQMRLLAYTEHGPDEVDEVRLLSVMKRPFPSEVVAWLERHQLRTATRPIVVAGNPELGFDRRVCAPIRCQGHLLGYLWLTDRDDSMTPADHEQAAMFAREAGIILYRELLLRDLDRSRERELLRDIVSEDIVLRRHAVAQLAELELFTSTGRVVAFVTPIPDVDDQEPADNARLAADEAFAHARRRLAPRSALHLLRPDHALLVVALGDPALRATGVAGFAQRLHEDLTSAFALDPGRLIVAAGGAVRTLREAAASYAQAMQAMRVAVATEYFGDVVCWSDLGVYRLLAELPTDSLGPDQLAPGLWTLIENPRTHFLVHTLECYLDNAGDIQRTCATLYLHRTSVYHRLRRIEQLAGVELADGDDRLALHLGLKLARLQRMTWATEPR